MLLLIFFGCMWYSLVEAFCRSNTSFKALVFNYTPSSLYNCLFIQAFREVFNITSLVQIRLFRIISIPSKFCYCRPPDHVISMECTALDFRCQCTQQKLQSICAVLTFDPQLKKILTFSVKDIYQLNYFICIKDFNAETNTSLKLNLFSFFICGYQHHQRKTICLYVYISDIRQILGYRTPVFIQRFPWRLHITITYNLQHLRL